MNTAIKLSPTNPSSINILLPVKSLAQCKTRLAPLMTLQQRQQLVIALLKNNLRILLRDFSQHHILVITPDLIVASIAKDFKVSVLLESSDLGLNQAVAAGTDWSLAQGYQTQLVLAPDIACLDKRELEYLLDQRPLQNKTTKQTAAAVIIGVANDGGTNALLTQPPNVIPSRYGSHSASIMKAESRQREIDCHLLHLPFLALDIDTPDDWMQWKANQQKQRKQKQSSQGRLPIQPRIAQPETTLCEVCL